MSATHGCSRSSQPQLPPVTSKVPEILQLPTQGHGLIQTTQASISIDAAFAIQLLLFFLSPADLKGTRIQHDFKEVCLSGHLPQDGSEMTGILAAGGQLSNDIH